MALPGWSAATHNAALMNSKSASRPIGDYALIGDTLSTALVSSEASIDWLCWPRHDSPAVLTRLLDSSKGGCCTVRFNGLAAAGRAYLAQTNVLETRFEGPQGKAGLIDLMPVLQIQQRASGPDGRPLGAVLRILECLQGSLEGRFSLRMTPDYGRVEAACRITAQGAVIDTPVGTVYVSCSERLIRVGDELIADFALGAGSHVFFAFTLGESSALRTMNAARRCLEDTAAYWRNWSSGIQYAGRYREAITRSALVLKLLTYSPTGAIIAAPTTSLPEAVPGERNFDYRYSWVRDSTFTVTAFCNLGLIHEAAEYLSFLNRVGLSGGQELRLLYGIDGEMPDEEVLNHLPGWNQVSPVRIGNAANDQKQLDIYGEVIIALHAYLEASDYVPPPCLGDTLAAVVSSLANTVVDVCHEKDCGIWELRSGPQHLQHTKALLWVALTRAVAIAKRIAGISVENSRRWSDAAVALRQEYEARTWDPRRRAYMQAYDSGVLDAAVLRTVLFGALEARDERTQSTLKAIEAELADGDLIYRYRTPDGLRGEEATFTACAFWRVGVLALAGDTKRAQPLFERLLRKANDVGLFAEQIDARSGDQRGNFPQAFTHMSVINHAVRLEDRLDHVTSE
jgi:GH15 family glucan-1,4-alpha-glucosidase